MTVNSHSSYESDQGSLTELWPGPKIVFVLWLWPTLSPVCFKKEDREPENFFSHYIEIK